MEACTSWRRVGCLFSGSSSNYSCAFENNQVAVNQCNIDSASTSTARCSYPFPGTNLTGVCVVVSANSGSVDLLTCQIGVVAAATGASNLSKVVESNLSKVVESKNVRAAITALAQLPGFAAAAAAVAPTGNANIHLGYIEKQGAPLLSAICPATFGKQTDP
jgi:hypothetical protein